MEVICCSLTYQFIPPPPPPTMGFLPWTSNPLLGCSGFSPPLPHDCQPDSRELVPSLRDQGFLRCTSGRGLFCLCGVCSPCFPAWLRLLAFPDVGVHRLLSSRTPDTRTILSLLRPCLVCLQGRPYPVWTSCPCIPHLAMVLTNGDPWDASLSKELP